MADVPPTSGSSRGASGGRHVVVIGGGIAGLSAAHAALARSKELGRPITLTVLEARPRFGGVLVTEHVDGFLLDGGPDSWVSSKPHATALARELGLGDSLIGTNEETRRFFVLWQGRLHAVPDGLVLGVPTRLVPLARTKLFSWTGKLRMAAEPFVPARRPFGPDDDESIAAFAARRLGREAAERLVAPLLGGISSADAGDVSVRAAFPQLVSMEREHGSLVIGMRIARRRSAATVTRGAGASAFTSLRGGIEEMAKALVERISAEGARLRPSTSARSLAKSRDGWVVALEGGDRLVADAVVLAVPAHASARLVAEVDDDLARRFSAVPYTSTATVFLAYRRQDVDHPLDGVGFVVPRAAGRRMLAATWVSSKWMGRAPEGYALLRVFFGGAADGSVLAREDAELAAMAHAELGAAMILRGSPLWTRVFRFERARAHMRVGHLAAMRALRERLARVAPGVRAAADGLDGANIPDCIRQGQDAGRALVEDAARADQNSARSL